jgi:hypothetical protein
MAGLSSFRNEYKRDADALAEALEKSLSDIGALLLPTSKL